MTVVLETIDAIEWDGDKRGDNWDRYHAPEQLMELMELSELMEYIMFMERIESK